MLYEHVKLLGPYIRNCDKRWYLKVIKSDGKRTTLSYPKYLMEKKLGRYLNENETVDHIDRNPSNNDFSNLRVIYRAKHAYEDSKFLKKKKFKCPQCNKYFELEGNKLRQVIYNTSKRKIKRAGPFCSKSCAGKYGTDIQHFGRKKLKVNKIKKEYEYRKDLKEIKSLEDVGK